MKVGYVAPMSIAAVSGGLRTQALQTIKHIKDFGTDPVLITPWDDIKNLHVDLIHVFGASIENVGIIDQIHAQGLPIVLSPVFFSNRSASVIRRALQMEKISSAIGSGIRSDFSIKKELCTKADLILPNTSDEASLITDGFSIPNHKVTVVPNGVETKFSESNSEAFRNKYKLDDFVLFVGQAGAPRKNVELLLQVADKLPTQLVIIGSFYEDEYSDRCRNLAQKAGNVTLIDTMEHDADLLTSAYAACKVFVLPSQYETPGIAAMEAALAHANIVITENGGTKDYFGRYAEYINPSSTTSILKGLLKALDKDRNSDLKDHILRNYTWERVAELTAQQYEKVVA